MDLPRAMRLILLLIPIIAANAWPERHRREPTPTPTPSSYLDYEEPDLQEDNEYGYSTTEFPRMYQETTDSFVEETTDSFVEETTDSFVEETTDSFVEETTDSFVEETTDSSVDQYLEESTTVADDLAFVFLDRLAVTNFSESSLSELFYENAKLEKYNFEKCAEQIRDGNLTEDIIHKNYRISQSSKDPNNPISDQVKPKYFTWEEAHDYCRMRCKELLTVDSEMKATILHHTMESDGVPGVWTSGRRCDFPGCMDGDDLGEEEWFWSTTGKMIYMDNIRNDLPYKWADNGLGWSQPDNSAFSVRGVNESCLVLHYDTKEKGLRLHDMPCNAKFNVVCEEPLDLNELRDDSVV